MISKHVFYVSDFVILNIGGVVIFRILSMLWKLCICWRRLFILIFQILLLLLSKKILSRRCRLKRYIIIMLSLVLRHSKRTVNAHLVKSTFS